LSKFGEAFSKSKVSNTWQLTLQITIYLLFNNSAFARILKEFLRVSMKISNSGANISSPPPISWATKPKPSPVDIINQSPLVDPSNSRQLVPVYIHPAHIADLQEALRNLTSTSCDLAHRQPKLELQANNISDAGNVQTVLYIGPPNPRQSQQVASNLPTEDQDLASSISRLFMSTPTSGRLASVTPTDPVMPTEPVTPTPKNPGLTPGIRTAPVIVSGMLSQATPKKMRYYVILVGKCTGIYHDEWRVYYFFIVCRLLTPP
jgi:hypothetical protein